ncbi:MAG: tRNA uridine-5-carboxymethylaminomethyl(34) synthesis enzyme MnmG, partial [Candidatus Aminicenantales bacterium]
LIKEKEYETFLKKQQKIDRTMIFLQQEKIKTKSNEKISLKDFLKKPEVKFKNVLEYKKFNLTDEEIRHLEAEIKYEGYIKKQEKEIARMIKIEKEKIPDNIDFNLIPGLTREAREQLAKSRPKTIGQAKKLPGITPAAVVNLHIYLNVQKRK